MARSKRRRHNYRKCHIQCRSPFSKFGFLTEFFADISSASADGVQLDGSMADDSATESAETESSLGADAGEAGAKVQGTNVNGAGQSGRLQLLICSDRSSPKYCPTFYCFAKRRCSGNARYCASHQSCLRIGVYNFDVVY